MRRHQLVEIEDLPWCPRAVRDGGTDWLRFMADRTKAFAPVAPKLRAAMEATGTSQVVDLCSGGGGPWITLEPELAKSGEVHVVLTDLYPNLRAQAFARAESGGRLATRAESVDATDVPVELDGVRTLFNCFHHFPPDLARAILADAVKKRRAIAIFEGIDHRGVGLVSMPFQVPAVLLLTPFVRPFSWTRLLLTYVIPLIPAIVLFDGTMSMLRIYLADELREMVRSIDDHETFDWDIGSTPLLGAPVGLTHLVGTPKPVAKRLR